MKRATIAGGVLVTLLLLLAVVAGRWALEQVVEPAEKNAPAVQPETTAMADHPSLLHGRITTQGGMIYEGRLRWGRGEEAFWGDYFNGFKKENPWASLLEPEQLPTRSDPVEIFGFELLSREEPIKLGRPFMSRFGDIERIDADAGKVRVTLRSGTVLDLDRFAFGDFDDGLRVWDDETGAVFLGPRQIRSIELVAGDNASSAPHRLHGTVSTEQEEFTGFLQWNREKGLGYDELVGDGEEGPLSLRFDRIRSIARRFEDGSVVTLVDGRELLLARSREVGEGKRGVYVDDPRYGRVLVSWEAFERVDFSRGGSGPSYDDYPPGQPLRGSVTTRDGRRLSGRLVYDLDESETTETLDAPWQGVNYTILFGLIASIVPPGADEGAAQHAELTLRDGEELQLESKGDLGPDNAGMLIFVDGREKPAYLPWGQVGRVDFEHPPAIPSRRKR